MTPVDDDVKEMIEASLNCMMVVADAQISDESAEALVSIADAIAEEFGIEKINTEVVDGTDENGDPVQVIREKRTPPQFRIIDGSKPDAPDDT
jgi:hypothetical protein